MAKIIRIKAGGRFPRVPKGTPRVTIAKSATAANRVQGADNRLGSSRRRPRRRKNSFLGYG